MIELITPALLITNYYDSLINRVDIYTEKRINEYKEKKSQPINDSYQSTNTYGVKSFNNPYEKTEDMFYFDKYPLIIEQLESYLNEVRRKSIDAIRKVQAENLDFYNANKEKFKVDRQNLTYEKLKELESSLFANRFCFLLNIEKIDKRSESIFDKNIRDNSLFKLHTVITDFYLRPSDIEHIEY